MSAWVWLGAAAAVGGLLSLFVILVSRTLRDIPHIDHECPICVAEAKSRISVTIRADASKANAAFARIRDAIEKSDP